MILSTIDDLIGHRSNPEMVKKIKDLVKEEDPVIGVYDIALFNYGPNKYYCSLHVELPDYMDVDEVDKLTRKIQHKIYKNWYYLDRSRCLFLQHKGQGSWRN